LKQVVSRGLGNLHEVPDIRVDDFLLLGLRGGLNPMIVYEKRKKKKIYRDADLRPLSKRERVCGKE